MTPKTHVQMCNMLAAHEYVACYQHDTQGAPGHYKFDMRDCGSEPMHCAAMIVGDAIVVSLYDDANKVSMFHCMGNGYESFKMFLDTFFG